MATLRRFVLLVGCIALGSLVGVIGLRLSGSATWFLAVPLLIAIAWFVVADPSACLPTNERPSENERSAK